MKKMFIALFVCVSLIMVGGNALAQEANANVQDVSANLSQDSHAISNVYDRKFVNPGVTSFPQTNGFFTSPTPDSSFRSIKEFLSLFADGVTIRMSEGAVDKLAKGGFDAEVNYQVVNDNDIIPRAYGKDYKGEKWLYITIEKPAGLKVTAMVDGEADDNDTNSLMVLGQMGQEVLADGCNVLVITAEGAHRAVEAAGWGVGAYATGGITNQSGKESLSPGGGTGYASNSSMTEDMPWLQGYAGVDASKPELAKSTKTQSVEYAQVSVNINGK